MSERIANGEWRIANRDVSCSLFAIRYSLFAFFSLLAVVPALAEPIRNSIAIFAGLDKTTGRIINFEVSIDETVQFGSLQITPRLCNTRPPTEEPQTTSFVEVDEQQSAKSAGKRIFSGWMFAASPGLHGVEHPVYDVWLVDCKGGKETVAEPLSPAPAPAAPAPERKRDRARKVEPVAPTPIEPAPIGPADIPNADQNAAPPPAASAPAPAAPAPAEKPAQKKKTRTPAAPSPQRRSAPEQQPAAAAPKPNSWLPF